MAKHSRKHRSKHSRKHGRKHSRKHTRRYRGGASMPMQQSLAQGQAFLQAHVGQHGGVADYPGQAFGGLSLPSDLVASARVGPTLDAFQQIAGMKDQTGGRRRRRTQRKGRKGSRKAHRKSHRKSHRKGRKGSRKQRGGEAPLSVMGQPLVQGSAASLGQNAEWDQFSNGAGPADFRRQ